MFLKIKALLKGIYFPCPLLTVLVFPWLLNIRQCLREIIVISYSFPLQKFTLFYHNYMGLADTWLNLR